LFKFAMITARIATMTSRQGQFGAAARVAALEMLLRRPVFAPEF
jgi:hypothetical protein